MKKRLLLVLVAAIVTLPTLLILRTGGADAQAGNLLVGNWAPRRDGVTVSGGGNTVTVSNAPGEADGAFQCIPVTGGTTYEFRAEISGVSGFASLELNWRRGPECDRQGTGPTLTGGGSIVGTAPGDAVFAELILTVSGGGSATFSNTYFGAPLGTVPPPPPPPPGPPPSPPVLAKRAWLPVLAQDGFAQ